MKIVIRETGHMKKIKLLDEKGREVTEELIEASDYYDPDTDQYVIPESDYERWLEVVNNIKSDKKEIGILAKMLNIDEKKIWDRIQQESCFCHDIEEEHLIRQSVIEDFRLKLSK
jgi:hypothetical protein